MDFSTPSVKQISDFFMYLYQDLNRRPSTIDGYRTAIVDTLGPTAQHIAHNADLHRLLSSFHRDRPKSSRNLPKWNLSVVLNELTKAPFDGLDGLNITMHTEVVIHSMNAYCGVGAKSVAHLMKFYLLQWEVMKVKFLINSNMTFA